VDDPPAGSAVRAGGARSFRCARSRGVAVEGTEGERFRQDVRTGAIGDDEITPVTGRVALAYGLLPRPRESGAHGALSAVRQLVSTGRGVVALGATWNPAAP
jgi:hypothetical protein